MTMIQSTEVVFVTVADHAIHSRNLVDTIVAVVSVFDDSFAAVVVNSETFFYKSLCLLKEFVY